MARLYETGTHPFLWQASIRPVLIHFLASQRKTGTHPFYIGMYIHIYTHIYVHIYTSQKECLHIFLCDPTPDEEICPKIVGKCWLGRSQSAFHSWLDQNLDMIKAGEDWTLELKVHKWTCTKIIAENDSDEIRIFYIAWLQKVFDFISTDYRPVSPCVLEGRSGGARIKSFGHLWSNMTDRWI